MLDALYCLFVDGHVVVLKMNPVNEPYGPVFDAGPRAADPRRVPGHRVRRGGRRGAPDAAATSWTRCTSLAASARTTPSSSVPARPGRGEGRGQPRFAKPIRSELGGASPTIVVPGPWSKADIAYQAQHLATQKLFSAGHTCVASQVLILPEGWDRKDQLLDALRSALAGAPDRAPFYPGTQERQDAFRAANPDAEALPGPQDRTLLVDVDPDSDHPGFHDEMFGPVYLTTAIDGADPGDFLAKAVAFANERLHGNLGANILIHPQTAKELGPQLEQAIADLRYGCIGVNVWSAFAFLSPRAAWGAYPGNTATDIQSGTGVVHNTLMFDRSQKSVTRAPFRPFHRSLRHPLDGLTVKPPWFLDNSTARSTARAFTMFAADPKPTRLPGIFIPAVRG